MNSKLTDVVTAIDLCKTIFSRIRLNFVWALGYNTMALPIAGGILYPVIKKVLPPFLAGIAMILSSLSVLSSSLLLNLYSPPHSRKKGYRQKWRQGSRGLGELKFLSSNYYESEVANAKCSSVKKGGNCNCSPKTCKCSGCKGCGNSDTEALESENSSENMMYPGCAKDWGQPCSCLHQCKCDGCEENKKMKLK